MQRQASAAGSTAHGTWSSQITTTTGVAPMMIRKPSDIISYSGIGKLPSARFRSARPSTTRQPHIGHVHMCRSEEHTSELQSLIRISNAVFCLKKQKHNKQST